MIRKILLLTIVGYVAATTTGKCCTEKFSPLNLELSGTEMAKWPQTADHFLVT